jgi:CHAT domain-containing protein/tetratricopeptide (TPR) repeat protein
MARPHIVLLAALALLASCRGREAEVQDLGGRARAQVRAGYLPRAAALADEAARVAAGSNDPELRGRAAILQAEVAILQGNLNAAKNQMQGLLVDAPGASFEDRARAEKVRGYLALKRRAFAEAEQHFSRAGVLARQSGDPTLPLELKVLVGRLRWDRGEPERADETYDQAARLARSGGDLFWEAAALNNRGFSRIQHERFDQALPFLWSAYHTAERAGAQTLAATALTNLGRCHYNLGDFVRSRELLEKGAAILERIQDHAFLQTALGEMGSNLLQIGDLPHARTYLQRALALARQHAVGSVLAWTRKLAELEIEAGRWSEAARHNEEAMSILVGPRDRHMVPDMMLDRAAILRAGGEAAAAETIYHRALAHPDATNLTKVDAEAGLARLHLERGQFAAADRFFGRAHARIERTRTNLENLDHRLSFLTSLVMVHRDYVERLVARGRSNEALAVVEGTRARVLSERFGGVASEPAEDDLRARARSRGELLLSYWVAPLRSHLWAVSGDRIQHFLLPGETELRARVEAVQAMIARGLRDPRALETSPLHELYQVLLGPVADQLPPGAAVVIAPDGPLHALAFGALVRSGSSRAHFLAEEVTLAIAPALTLLPARRSQPLDAWSGPVLAVGDPVTGEPGFPTLADSGTELASLQHHFRDAPVQLFRGEAAQPDRLRAFKGQRLSILHFAAHAVANPGSPLDSTIVLSPGANGNRFSAREALELGIGAEVVTLSACRSALARSYFGEGPVGLAWAFLRGGSAHVVAGLWDVADDSTARLMDRFYAQLRAGQSVPQALQRAQRALIDSGSSDRLPYHWAPFVAYLGPRPPTAARADLIR